MSNNKPSFNDSSHQYSDTASAIEKTQDQMEYLNKISRKLAKLTSYHPQLIDEVIHLQNYKPLVQLQDLGNTLRTRNGNLATGNALQGITHQGPGDCLL